MKEELKNKLAFAKAKKKENKKFYRKLSLRPIKKLDDLFQEAHDKTFQKIDCLDCANCCKTTSPILYDKDIERMASFFRMKSIKFFNQYLKIDEDGDQVLKSSPCPFLLEDNKCMAYESRPKACREYPHTDRKRIHQILDTTQKNLNVCPAVVDITEIVKSKNIV